MFRDAPTFHRDGDDHAIFVTGAPGSQQHDEERIDPLDDVFGSAPASPTLLGGRPTENGSSGGPSNEGPSDIPRLRSLHVTNGYREGIAVSKEKHMQEGFDEGYTLGAELGLKAGWCLGALEGIRHALPSASQANEVATSANGSSVCRKDVQKLLGEADEELKIQSLFGSAYFGEDGIWLYDVPGQEQENESTTFEKVAAAHPVVRKWTDQAIAISNEIGLAFP